MTFTALDLVAAAKQQITEIPPVEAETELASTVFIDVREPQEFEAGHITGAINIPRGVLEFKVIEYSAIAPDKKVIVYCQSGARAALATATLHQLGYTQAVSLEGGFIAWSKRSYPVEKYTL